MLIPHWPSALIGRCHPIYISYKKYTHKKKPVMLHCHRICHSICCHVCCVIIIIIVVFIFVIAVFIVVVVVFIIAVFINYALFLGFNVESVSHLNGWAHLDRTQIIGKRSMRAFERWWEHVYTCCRWFVISKIRQSIKQVITH